MVVFFSILYNPERNAIDNIIKSIRHGFKPIVYINKADLDLVRELEDLGVIILGENNNVGIGKAFNDLEDELILLGAKYYLYFDQDTIVSDYAWKSIAESHEKLFDEKTGFIFYTSEPLIKYQEYIVISSGCFFSVDNLNKIGKHDVSYFVEGSDYEYCLRSKSKGLFIKKKRIDGIDHNSLQDNKVTRRFGIEFNIRVYGDSRLKDFNMAHYKLLKFALNNFQVPEFVFLLKSFLGFNFNELKSRLLK